LAPFNKSDKNVYLDWSEAKLLLKLMCLLLVFAQRT